jgi:hypothetical protein
VRAPESIFATHFTQSSACMRANSRLPLPHWEVHPMTRSHPSTSRSRPVIDRWPRLTAAAVAGVAVGSLIARRAVRSAGQPAKVTAASEAADPSEPVTSPNQFLNHAATRLRLAGTAAGGRLSAARRAAWREFVRADPGPRGGPGTAGPAIPAATTSLANAPEPGGNPDHPLHAPASSDQ